MTTVKSFTCLECNYSSCVKCNFERHCSSKKHLAVVEKKEIENAAIALVDASKVAAEQAALAESKAAHEAELENHSH